MTVIGKKYQFDGNGNDYREANLQGVEAELSVEDKAYQKAQRANWFFQFWILYQRYVLCSRRNCVSNIFFMNLRRKIDGSIFVTVLNCSANYRQCYDWNFVWVYLFWSGRDRKYRTWKLHLFVWFGTVCGLYRKNGRNAIM